MIGFPRRSCGRDCVGMRVRGSLPQLSCVSVLSTKWDLFLPVIPKSPMVMTEKLRLGSAGIVGV